MHEQTRIYRVSEVPKCPTFTIELKWVYEILLHQEFSPVSRHLTQSHVVSVGTYSTGGQIQ